MARPVVNLDLFIQLAQAAGLDPANVSKVTVEYFPGLPPTITFQTWPNEATAAVLEGR